MKAKMSYEKERLSRRRLLGAGSTMLTATAFAAACSGGKGTAGTGPRAVADASPKAVQQQGQPKAGGTFNTRLQVNPPNFDPSRDINISKYWIQYNLYSNLVRYKMGPGVDPATAEVEPDVALSWETPDAQTYIFKIRPGVKFHDGSTLTGEDIKFSIDYVATKHPTNEKFFLWDSIDKGRVEVVNDTTIKVPLKSPYFAFLYAVGWQPEAAVISRATVEKHGGDLRKVVNGTGPFKLETFQDNVNYVMVRHGDYFRQGQPYLDKINNFVINDVNTAIAQLRAKQLDFEPTLNKQQVDALKASTKDLQFATVPGGSNASLMLLVDRPPFNDIRLRQALSLALDRQQLVKVLTHGEGTTIGPIGPHLVDWTVRDPSTLPNIKQDVQKAKQLVEAAGYKPGELKFRINPSNQTPAYSDWAQLLKQHLSQIGVELEIQVVEHAQWFRTVIERNFQIFQWARLPDYDPEGYIYPYYTKDGGRNFGNIDDPELHNLAIKQREAKTKEERKKIIDEFQRLATERVYLVPSHDGVRHIAWWPHLKNYFPHMSYEDRRADAVWKDLS